MIALLVVVGAATCLTIGWVLARSLPRPVGGPIPEAPAASPQFAGEVLERHPTGVFVGGSDGQIAYRNAAARSMAGTHVGVLIDEAVERHLRDAVAGARNDETLELFGPPKRIVMIAAEPLHDGWAVAFVDDITEQRRSHRARTDFVANVSHELRTPIGALLVLAETVVGEDDPAVVERVVARMSAEAERASRTIDHLLELSEIEAGVERAFLDVGVSAIVQGAVNRAQELATQRGIAVEVAGADGGAVVRGDPGQLVSAIGNIVENAVKYSDAGDRVRVTVTEGDGVVDVAVCDEGVGIPRQDLDRIFERFYRVDRARSRETGGTGLGLSIVRHVAENHDGSVSVTSTEGAGSEFVVRLPLAGGAREVGSDVRRREEVG